MKYINLIKLILKLILFNIIVSKDLFEDYYEKASEILKTMSKYEKIGQLFFPRYSRETADYQLKKYFPAGFILFANNLVNHTETELIEELNQIQNLSKIPLVFGVDEEGGTVCRISLYFRPEKFPSPRESFIKGGISEILSIEKEKINLLKKLKFNVNFAPVADISVNSSDYIYARTLGENASITSEYINSVVDLYEKGTLTCCLKHFPGYGNNRNTHDDITHDYRSLDYLKQNDLIPFINAINHKVPMIMASHNIVMEIDNEYPSSISKKVHDLLRDEYGYTGLIVTDSLSMGAITKYSKNISAAVLAIMAGNDMIVTSTFEDHINELIKAVDNNEIDISLIEKAAKRVIAWKLKYIYEQENNGKNNKNNKKIILFIFLGVGIFGIILILSFLLYKYKNRNKDKSENEEKDIEEKNNEGLIRDTNNSK